MRSWRGRAGTGRDREKVEEVLEKKGEVEESKALRKGLWRVRSEV